MNKELRLDFTIDEMWALKAMSIPIQISQIECDEIETENSQGNDRIAKVVEQKLVPQIPATTRIISIDGFDGVGKSTIATCLTNLVRFPHVNIDEYLERQKGYFFAALKFHEISKAVRNAVKFSRGVIVEGCLVGDVLKKVGINADFKIYVMRTARMRSNPEIEDVREFDTLYGDQPTEAFIAKLEEKTRRWAKLPKSLGGGGSGELPNLERELILYHRNSRPHDHADVIIKIVHWS